MTYDLGIFGKFDSLVVEGQKAIFEDVTERLYVRFNDEEITEAVYNDTDVFRLLENLRVLDELHDNILSKIK